MNVRLITRHAVRSALCALFVIPTLAHAVAVYLVGDGYAQGSESFTLTAPVSIAVIPTGAGGFAGRIGTTSPPTTSIFFWCAELSQTFSFGASPPYVYQLNPLSNTLLSQLFTEVGGSGSILSGASSEAKTDLSAAFQLAIWEILFEGGTYGGLNVSSGNFKATGDHDGDAIAQANIWLAALNAGSPAGTALYLLHNDNNQDFITDTNTPPGITVPEPSPLPLLGVGILGLIFVMRRRTQQALR
jgi:hypothetical protein